jgi:hypothetical protein
MIDLAEQAGAEFSSNRKFGTFLSEATLHIGETEEELGKKNDILVQMVLFENSTPHATPEYV